jgi:hypothetical protein
VLLPPPQTLLTPPARQKGGFSSTPHKNSFLSQRPFFGTIWGSRLKIVP